MEKFIKERPYRWIQVSELSMNQLEDTLRTFLKENLERVMKEELAQVLDVEHSEANSTKNGTYVGWLEKAIIGMYTSGIGTREIAPCN